MSNTPEWWEILIGIILIITGCCLFFLYRKSKVEVDEYKKRQLEELNKKDRKKYYSSYEEAKLILPWSQRIKLLLWPIIGMSLIIIGVSISTGVVFAFFTR